MIFPPEGAPPPARRPRIALFVLEALPNARAARRFVDRHRADIAFVGLSNAERPNAGGFVGQTLKHLRRSGPGFLPYLLVNFALPDLGVALFPLLSRFNRRPLPPAAVPLKRLCASYGLPSFRVDDVNGEAMAAAFRQHRPDLIVAFHFDQIFSAGTLRRAPLGGINVHPALLPRHRGPVPTTHALLDDSAAFGVTVHRLAERIDAGGILAQQALDLPPDTSASGAALALHDIGGHLLDDVLADIARNGMPEGRQVPTLPYCGFPSPALLRSLRRADKRLVRSADWCAALTLSGVAERH